MANKLSWDPPKWKSYSLNEGLFRVELENGKVYTGSLLPTHIQMHYDHSLMCLRIFGVDFATGFVKELNELSKVLNLDLQHGHWPEYFNVAGFLKTYYERVAKIEESFTKSTIYIESEFNITPKFTL